MRFGVFLLFLVLPRTLAAHDVPWINYGVLGGETVMETSGDDVDETALFAIASIGKTMTAVAVLRMVERGEVGLDAEVTELLSGIDLGGLDGIDGVTVRHLLTMTSGLADYYTDDQVEVARNDPARWRTPRGALSFAEDEPALFAPGEGFNYSNTNYLLLGMICEAVTGDSYAQVMAREVFRPSGMTDSFVFGSRPLPDYFVGGHAGETHVRAYYEGEGFGDGGVLASARDLVAFYEALFLSDDLISPATRRDMLRDPVGEGYGMGVVVEEGLVGHSGGDLGFASDVVMDPATGDIALVFIGDENGATDWALDQLDPR